MRRTTIQNVVDRQRRPPRPRRGLRLPREGGEGGERQDGERTHAYFPWQTFWSVVSRNGAKGQLT